MAHKRKANGFFKSKGLSALIPDAYTLLERDFWKDVVSKSRQMDEHHDGISLHEWARPGWTYHAKGGFLCYTCPIDSTF